MMDQPLNEKTNIAHVAALRLCTSCGACSGVCPVYAIHFEETTGGYLLPTVDEKVCTLCGLCASVCPGIHFGASLRAKMPHDPFTGNALGAFVGTAVDRQLFANSQSGGIVSALLLHALDTGQITGAATVSMEAGTPPRPVVHIARDKQELLRAQKSKYCPVPLLHFLSDLKNLDGPIAVVGISCQLQGLWNVLDKKTALRSKIAFTIGLVCDRVLTYAATDYLFAAVDANGRSAPMMLHFRDKGLQSGYPGDVHIFAADGTSVVLPAAARMRIKDYFTPARCRLCFDKMNVFADITVGDPHGLPDVDRRHGESMLVARTETGQGLVQSAQKGNAINIRQVGYEQVLSGQGVTTKKEQWRAYAEAWEKTGRICPDFFPLVQPSVPQPMKLAKYSADLEYTIGLDRFTTREDLVRFVAQQVRRKQVINRLLTPLRLARRLMKKFL